LEAMESSLVHRYMKCHHNVAWCEPIAQGTPWDFRFGNSCHYCLENFLNDVIEDIIVSAALSLFKEHSIHDVSKLLNCPANFLFSSSSSSFLVCFYGFWDRVLLCHSVWPGTCCVPQVGLKLMILQPPEC
jgi:hypothetical protein